MTTARTTEPRAILGNHQTGSFVKGVVEADVDRGPVVRDVVQMPAALADLSPGQRRRDAFQSRGRGRRLHHEPVGSEGMPPRVEDDENHGQRVKAKNPLLPRSYQETTVSGHICRNAPFFSRTYPIRAEEGADEGADPARPAG
ncbi:uncharacterized protein MAM_06337 [Metarhizium album ARSEF 1941]|uniref:Uncharacterized protein n=1 Tax=Metarhizium album (strain ARSEF 1941) TaxID=1081103 RepID=A0A0B2WRW8_METAS|nr:uncharacterized protein MAM_06337 [Metarhizium album ARSEF 1941]KHN95725.1 hypothetical protein MAM_06337 [Metarhizium album ARSEF 1941]